mgnify:CR=1 FL=1
MKKQITYHLVDNQEGFNNCKPIIQEYLVTLGIDLAYMNLADEFEQMSTMYGSGQGAFFLAKDDKNSIGCVGVRKIDNETAELKRLYVQDTYRGYQIGITLLQKAIEVARVLGYKKIRLDVIPTLVKAKELYFSFGFYEIDQYFQNPVDGTTYMEKRLLE